jgi:hypothetical protein
MSTLPPDKPKAVYEFFKSLGSTDEQALDAEKLHVGKFDYVGDVLVLKQTTAPADDPKSVERMRELVSHLLPTAVAVDEADAAFLGKGSLTAKMNYAKKHGMDEANRVAKLYGLHGVSDTRAGVKPTDMPGEKKDAKQRDNPWLDNETNVDPRTGKYRQSALNRQFALARASVQAATGIAAAAGAKLGDIRPPGRSRRVA